MKNVKKSVVEETRLGIYVWEMPDGRWVGDDDGNYLSVSSFKDDQSRIAAITQAVRSYGINEGKAVFLAGRRKINDEEYQEQLQRLEWGLTPDPLDIGEYKDSLRIPRND